MSEAATPLTATKSSAAPSSEINGDAGAQWAGCWAEQFPLRAKGRNLVNTRGDRYKLCGINWYGASDALHVVGGLRNQPLADICAAVSLSPFHTSFRKRRMLLGISFLPNMLLIAECLARLICLCE